MSEYGAKIYYQRKVFDRKSIKSSKIIKELDPTGVQLIAGVGDFVLVADERPTIEDIYFPFITYFDGGDVEQLYSFESSTQQTGKKEWKVRTADIIAQLDKYTFLGGFYDNKNVGELLEEIARRTGALGTAFTLDESYANATVSGYLPVSTCRTAVMQIVFALGCLVKVRGLNVILYPMPTEVSQTIDINRVIMSNNRFISSQYSAVEVACHEYVESEERWYKHYSAPSEDWGTETLILFDEPLYDVQIDGMTSVELVKWGANYAVVKQGEGWTLTGLKYSHSTRTQTVGDVVQGKTAKINTATLVTSANLDEVAQRCYNRICKAQTLRCKIVDGKHIVYHYGGIYGTSKYGEAVYGDKPIKVVTRDNPTSIGDYVAIDAPFWGIVKGLITEQSYTLNGGQLFKDCVITMYTED